MLCLEKLATNTSIYVWLKKNDQKNKLFKKKRFYNWLLKLKLVLSSFFLVKGRKTGRQSQIDPNV